MSVNDPRLIVGANSERLDVLVSTVPIEKLEPVKVKPNSVAVELNPFELKAPSVVH